MGGEDEFVDEVSYFDAARGRGGGAIAGGAMSSPTAAEAAGRGRDALAVALAPRAPPTWW